MKRTALLRHQHAGHRPLPPDPAGRHAAVLVAAVVLAHQGLSLAWSLVVVALAPVVTIAGYEAIGRRHLQDHRDRRLVNVAIR